MGLSAAPIAAASTQAAYAQTTRLENVQLRGGMDGTSFGLSPRDLDDQSAAFQDMLNAASEREIPVYLPAGNYIISNITLPKNVRIIGVPGATRILYRGGGFLFQGSDNERIILRDLVIDGLNRTMDDTNGGLIQLQNVSQVLIENCDIVGAAHNAIWLAVSPDRRESVWAVKRISNRNRDSRMRYGIRYSLVKDQRLLPRRFFHVPCNQPPFF